MRYTDRASGALLQHLPSVARWPCVSEVVLDVVFGQPVLAAASSLLLLPLIDQPAEARSLITKLKALSLPGRAALPGIEALAGSLTRLAVEEVLLRCPAFAPYGSTGGPRPSLELGHLALTHIESPEDAANINSSIAGCGGQLSVGRLVVEESCRLPDLRRAWGLVARAQSVELGGLTRGDRNFKLESCEAQAQGAAQGPGDCEVLLLRGPAAGDLCQLDSEALAECVGAARGATGCGGGRQEAHG
ncbi:hypothetical protein HYH03_010686 [Edaphochlamys debaryana]|uniref:Uncharacterized protein n=1 Tax=Edaphochlamys debaryana TaxID=47281 RepID=A0A835Y4R8_9CHLO|nr:hypothetical protein HYH03_010686 [Edaphochlamys debaryana]|eukprot:KAG2491014.1 hypothetical protein HYH03_010686 [Edaphochlamys debaryana]